MADNSVAPGTGETFAADDIGGVKFFRHKNALGPDGTHTADQGGVDLGSGVGAAFVRNRPYSGEQQQTSSGLTTASTNYTNGDVLGAGWTFTSMAAANGGCGRITGAHLLDKGDVLSAVELWFASATITFGTDNAAPSISDADAQLIVGRIQLAPSRDLGGNRHLPGDYISLPYHCDATSLFVYAVTLADNNFFAAATDLWLQLYYDLA